MNMKGKKISIGIVVLLIVIIGLGVLVNTSFAYPDKYSDEYTDVWNEADKNGDGVITFKEGVIDGSDEYLILTMAYTKGTGNYVTAYDMGTYYVIYDKDNSGDLDRDEFYDLLTKEVLPYWIG